MIRVPESILTKIKKQACQELPNEACGYLCGRKSADGNFEVADIIEMTNADASPEHYSFVPVEQFAALKKSRARELLLVAVYHSHPETPARMSQEDIRLANDTEIIYLIYSLPQNEIKGFKVDEKKHITNYKVEVIQ